MYTKIEVEAIISSLATQIKAAIGDRLASVILYGSYARDDFDEGSDVDVMILIDAKHERITAYWDIIGDITSELVYQYNLLITPVIQSDEIFNKYKDASGFYKNILTEGVRINAWCQ